MAEIINLRRARKQAKRTEKDAAAATNRLAFGEAKGRKAARTAETDRQDRTLDGAMRAPVPGKTPDPDAEPR